jgi:hypothetical protein
VPDGRAIAIGLALCLHAAAAVAQLDAAGCVESGGTWDTRDARAPKGTCVPDTAEKCGERGGTFRRVCLAGRLQCVMPARDAGKACTDSSQCEHGCVDAGRAPAADGLFIGACRRDNDPCGTFPIISNGKRIGSVVAD